MYHQNNDLDNYYLQGIVPNYIQKPLKSGSSRIHPTEKPVSLLEYLLSLFSVEGDTVLDCFAGSGSTGEASLNLKRNIILIEQDKNFYEAIVKRMENCSKNEDIITIHSEK